MKKWTWILLMVGLTLLVACSEDEFIYPSVLTDVALLKTDAEKRVVSLILDDGRNYGITNEDFKTTHANSYLRALATYLITDSTHAKLYSATSVAVLHDSTAVQQRDAVAALSVWQSGGFINMHLQPKTQGKISLHYWGFGIDSIADHHHYLSLHHAQNADPVSYSTDVYASLQLSQVDKILVAGDTVSMTIETFQGPKIWQFIYK